ncbi:laminin subunit beta-4-like isoform X2 [Plectropomus leopardus]|uniref:laminin subunit beta-4-like isoform X2 n=1 Tax=Plectropomus leopardus TaxID=160734 RepID=UPI001C4C54B6|nr:laminin subunit beta-4-like isoform X2 [Plectropomus leopardus]
MLRQQMKNISVTEINRDIYQAEKAQDKANNDLDTATRDRDVAKDRIQDMRDKLDNIETELMNYPPEDLKSHIEALKKKTEQNRETARDALKAAGSAVDQTTSTKPLDNVMKLFELLRQKNSNQTTQDEAAQRLTTIRDEAETMRRHVEDKLRQIQDIEKKIQQLIKNKENKAAEVSSLLDIVDSLRREISKRAEGYASCTS